MKCSRCQRENPAAAKFCGGCGTELESACPACHALNPPANEFCHECGVRLPRGPAPAPFASPRAYTPRHLAERILISRHALEGERKQVTILFCDMANSTALAERLGPEAMHTLLDRFFDLALAEVHRYEGTINQFLGDGFMALFGAPLTHEDHARRAILAAWAIQRALPALRAAPPGAGDLAVRMGLHGGPVVVGKIGDNLRMDYTAVGDTTHLAARLQQLAEPGTIYLSDSTYRTIQEYADCEVLGRRKVKGRVEPVLVYKVLGVRTHPEPGGVSEGRGIESPLVGREAEFAVLEGCIARLREGRGGVAFVFGEAGVGKSRLVTEVRQKDLGQAVRWLEGRGLSFGHGISYLPFLEIIKREMGITEHDDEGQAWAKLEQRIRALFPDEVAETLPYLATLLAIRVGGELEDRVKYLDGRAMGRQVLRTSRRLFERLSEEHPLVLLIEDIHWIDQSSAELLEHLLPLVETVPLLVCVISRPDPPASAARLQQLAATRWPDRYTEISLLPLTPPDSLHLVRNLLGTDELPLPLRDLILSKAEGNPFFMEEVVRSLTAMGALVRDPTTGKLRATRQVEEITIPDTIQGVIMARVDRLQEDVKEVLKLAAVIGRTFFYRVLRAIGEEERELDRNLADLQQIELIRRRRLVPELEFIFKHALVQEATYQSILLDRRRRLHRQVAESTEALFRDRLEEFYGVLAYHYLLAEEWEKAHDYLLKSGDQAGKVAADAEALAHYRQAVTAYARVFGDRWNPLERAILERKMGEALFRRGDHQQALQHLGRALADLGHPYPTSRGGIRLALVRQLLRQVAHRLAPRLLLRRPAVPAPPSVEERAHICELMGWIDYFLDQERLILDVVMLLNVSERGGHAVGVVQGATGMGLICDLLPIFWLAGRYHRRAMRLAELSQHPLAFGLARLGHAVHDYHLGNWQSALEDFRQAARHYRETGDLRAWGVSAQMIAWVLRLQANFPASLEVSKEIVAVGQEMADHQVWGWGLHGWGWTLWHTGAFDEAVQHLREAVEFYGAVPDYPAVAEAMSDLGRCYLRQGRLSEALAALEDSNRLIAERGLRGVVCTRPRMGLAEAYLAVVEQAGGQERETALKRAHHACRLALKQSRIDRGSVATAWRLRGSCEWFRGNGGAAQKWWHRSMAAAERLGARYELGLAHLEMGRWPGDRAHLERAAEIFSEVGAQFDLARTRRLLEG